jgi:hypothetical protein
MAAKFTVNIEADSITLEAFGVKTKSEDRLQFEYGDWKLTIHSYCAYYEYFEYQMTIEMLEEGKILFSCKKITDDEEDYDFDDDNIDNFDNDDLDDNNNSFDDEIENNREGKYEKLEITKTLKISEDDYCVCFEKKSEKKSMPLPTLIVINLSFFL